MIYNKEKHNQLVIRSQDLKNQGKNLFLENPEENLELAKYNVKCRRTSFLDSPRKFCSNNEESSR